MQSLACNKLRVYKMQGATRKIRELFVQMVDSNCRNHSGNFLASGTVFAVHSSVQRKMLPSDYRSDCWWFFDVSVCTKCPVQDFISWMYWVMITKKTNGPDCVVVDFRSGKINSGSWFQTRTSFNRWIITTSHSSFLCFDSVEFPIRGYNWSNV